MYKHMHPEKVANNPKGDVYMQKKWEFSTSQVVALAALALVCIFAAFVVGRKSAKEAYSVRVPSNVTLLTASGAELDDDARTMMSMLGYSDVEFHPYCTGGRVLESPKRESGLCVHTEMHIYHVHSDDIIIVESADGEYSFCEAIYGDQESHGWVFSHKRGETYVHGCTTSYSKAYMRVYVFNIEMNTVYRLY